MSGAPATTTTPPVLELEGIHTYYGAIHALKGVTLEVSEGEIVTLLGANGAGKSSTLRSINGLNVRGGAGSASAARTLLSTRRTTSSRGGRASPRGASSSSDDRAENLEMGASTYRGMEKAGDCAGLNRPGS